MEEQDYEGDYLRDKALIEAEKQMKLEAEWREMEEYEQQLPAKITVLIEIPKKEKYENKTLSEYIKELIALESKGFGDLSVVQFFPDDEEETYIRRVTDIRLAKVRDINVDSLQCEFVGFENNGENIYCPIITKEECNCICV